MSIKIKKVTVTTCLLDYTEAGTEHRFELQYLPTDWLSDNPIVRQRKDGKWVVGYLCHDEDCHNPLEDCDGLGAIYTAHRHAGQEAHRAFQKALGLDEYWQRDRRLKSNPLAVPLDVYDHSGQVYAVSGSCKAQMFPDQRWDVAHGGAVWVPDDCCRETIWHDAAKSFLPEYVSIGYRSEKPYGEGGKGFLNRIVVDIHLASFKQSGDWGHNTARLRENVVPGFHTLYPKGYKSFRKAAEAALRFFHIKPELKEMQRRLREVAVRMAEGVVDEYNCWLAGDCWGIFVEVFDRDYESVIGSDDAVWGFIGEKYARKELETLMNLVLQNQEVSCDT